MEDEEGCKESYGTNKYECSCVIMTTYKVLCTCVIVKKLLHDKFIRLYEIQTYYKRL